MAKDVKITEIPSDEIVEFECVALTAVRGENYDFTYVFTDKGMWFKRHKGFYLIDIGSRESEFVPYESFTKAERFKIWRTSGFKFRFNGAVFGLTVHFREHTDEVEKILTKYLSL